MRLLLGCVRRWYALSLRSEAAAAPSSRLAAKRALPSTPSPSHMRTTVAEKQRRPCRLTPLTLCGLTHWKPPVTLLSLPLGDGGWDAKSLTWLTLKTLKIEACSRRAAPRLAREIVSSSALRALTVGG